MHKFRDQASSRTENGSTPKCLPAAVASVVCVLLATPCPAATEEEVEAALQREQEALELIALGYVTWADVDPEELARTLENPAVIHSPDRIETGTNFFCSEPSDSARFFDMQGKVLWELEGVAPAPTLKDNRCKLIEFHDASHVLMLHESTQVSSMNWHSKQNWSLRGRYHHDLAVNANGDIYALFDRKANFPAIDPNGPVFDTEIVQISATGEILSRVSLSQLVLGNQAMLDDIRNRPRKKPEHRFRTRVWNAYHAIYCANVLSELARSHSDYLMEFLGSTCSVSHSKMERRPWDVFHVNSLEFIPGDLEFSGGIRIPAGALLISIRNLNTIAIVDLEQERILWTWGDGELQEQHHPSMLPNGNILIFDNGVERKFSRLLELDPRKDEIVWNYQAVPPEDFFTESRGAVQALPGGNLLVTESEKGRLFEVTRSGEVVWEFWNPEVSDDGKKRATIYRAGRLFPADIRNLDWPGPPIAGMSEP